MKAENNSHWAQGRDRCYRTREGECDTFKAKDSSVQRLGQECWKLSRSLDAKGHGTLLKGFKQEHNIHYFIHSFNRKSLASAGGQACRLWLYHRCLHEAVRWRTRAV